MSSLYYCTKENNDCPRKEECQRYLNSENQRQATLFKMACIEDNNYVLFMEHIEKKEGES